MRNGGLKNRRTMLNLGEKAPSESERAYLIIREGIIKGKYKPGERLLEEWLAKEFQLSRTPIREALMRLYQEGWVVKHPHRGVVVKAFDKKELEDIIEVRSVLEGYATRMIASSCDESLVRKLKDVIFSVELALKEGKIQEAIELNTSFHDLIYERCGNSVLLRMIGQLRDYFYRYRVLLLNLAGMLERSIEDHKRLLDLIENGTPDEVERFTRKHILKGLDALKSIVF